MVAPADSLAGRQVLREGAVVPMAAAPVQDEQGALTSHVSEVLSPSPSLVQETPITAMMPSEEAPDGMRFGEEHEEPLPFLGDAATAAPTRQRRKIQIPAMHFTIPPFLRSSKVGAIGIAIAGVLIAFLVANEVLLRVDVRVVPRTEAVTLPVAMRVTVGETTDGAVPGQRVSVTEEVRRTVPASGQSERRSRATGVIAIESSYNADQTLVATTRFISQDGKLFRLDNTIVVPSGGSVDAQVTADESGPDHNIGPATFSIPGFQGDPRQFQFVARSREAMRGGASGNVRVVTADDVARAREGIDQELREKLERAFSAQVVSDLTVLSEARAENITVSVDQDADAVADAVSATAQGTFSAIAYRQSDLEAAVLRVLRERIAEGTDIVEDSIVMTSTVAGSDRDAGMLDLEIAVEARAAWQVDEALVRDAVAGRREAEIRSWLSAYNPVERAQIEFRPFWVSVAPDNPDRIRVRTGFSF